MATHRRLISAEGPDYYPTPEIGTMSLLKYEKFEGNILEPCCGDGAISKILEIAGYRVFSFDLYDRGYGNVKDIFDTDHLYYDNIVTNPPFNIAEKVLKRAFKLSRRKVALLLRTSFLEGQKRYQNIFNGFPPSRVHVFARRLSIYKSGIDKKGGGTTSYSWFVWDKEDKTRETRINWIAP